MYWDFTPSKILEHFGFQSTRQTAAKFEPCKGIEKDEHKDVPARSDVAGEDCVRRT